MKKCTKISILSLSFTLFALSSYGQSRNDLEAERNNIISQIEIAEEQIKIAEQSTKVNTLKLKALNNKIKAREKLITNLKDQLALSLSILHTNSDSLAKMDSNLIMLQHSYREIMNFAYIREKTKSKWLTIFSAESLNEGILTWKYASQFQSYVEAKKIEIQRLKEAIVNTNQSIIEENEHTDKLLEEEKKNFSLLAIAKNEASNIVQKLKGKEKELRADMTLKKREREKLNQRIENIILAELAKRNNVANPISSNISKKNGLIWPVKKGYISSPFGKQKHPTLSNLTINNNGVDISSVANANVYSVLDGTIVGVTSIPGYDTMIIIEHENYYTVYSKLQNSMVSKGQTVSTNQKIGILGSSGILHFEIWKGKQKLNPQNWLQNK